MSEKRKVIVIGGGAAGMMAAYAAAKEGSAVFLFEKNEKLGKKLFITGKGRCNLTNHTDAEGLLAHVVRNPRFLYSAFYSFDAESMMGLMESSGLKLKTERGNRVFPASDKSSDVIRTLEGLLKEHGVRISLRAPVKGLLMEKGVCQGILFADGREMRADAVIVATGGLSYPSTGSTGDGYLFAKTAALEVKEAIPSLVPFEAEEEYIKRLQGVSLKNVSLKLFSGKKKLFGEQGEMRFTHFGVSGPLVLTASTRISGMEVSK
ncbi:MAG: aminoacetone oxidase family FAD-binding enzyme, partial [Lachnospiraceae bacterium]|nr:aminoacetone oxidase family FAD-binding enzyme [Lachnospiraceae bacterium]